MDFSELVNMIPVSKRQPLSNKLTDFILTSKSDDKMPSALAHTLLHYWQRNLLESELGLAALLEASVLLEPEETLAVFSELQLTNVTEEIRAKMNTQGR
jgi:hypothetical protein